MDTAHVKLIRTISAEFLRRKLQSISFGIGAGIVASLILAIWLVSLNAWWLLLAVPIVLISIIGIIGILVAFLAVRLLRPELNKVQSGAVANFVDKLERVAESVQTPVFLIIFKVVRDIIRPCGTTFVQTVANDSTSLRPDFKTLQATFND